MLHILGMGCFHPSNVLDNEFIVSLGGDTTVEWIMDKIGIETRVTTLPLDYIRETKNQDTRLGREVASHTPTALGVKAGEEALRRAGIGPEKIGLVIGDTCTPNDLAPCEAQRVAHGLGIIAPAYDVQTACPAFALHMDYLSGFREEMLPEYVLCVSTAAMTQKVNYNDRTDGAIWGDGAAAWVVSTQHEGKLRLLDTVFAADPSRCGAVVVDTFGFFRQDGRAVRDFSVRQTVRLLKAFEEKHGIDWTKDIFVGHQANTTMLRQIAENREIPPSSHWHNVTHLGNQAAAGAPAVIAQNWNDIKPGQKIAVAVIGAGLSWGAVLVEGV